jgi:hypothetical protein
MIWVELQILLISNVLYCAFCGSTSHFAAQVAGPAIEACAVRHTAFAKHLPEFLSASHISFGANSQLGVVPAPQKTGAPEPQLTAPLEEQVATCGPRQRLTP